MRQICTAEELKEKIIAAIDKVGRTTPSGKPIYGGRLTKKQLMTFPKGSYLVSNCYSSFDGKPMVDLQLGSSESRNQLWEDIKSAGADGRICYVFKDYDDYSTYLEKLYMWRSIQRLGNREK